MNTLPRIRSVRQLVIHSVSQSVSQSNRCPLESCVNIDAQNPFNFQKIFTFLAELRHAFFI